MDLFDVFSFKNLYKAYLRCRKNKRCRKSALQFEINAEENILKLEEELKAHTYLPLPSTCFVTKSPKVREIFAANFRDRIVHHLLVAYLEQKWEPKFIHDSFACRKGKGTHAATKRLQQFMRKVSHNGSRRAFFIHIDIKSFFVSISKQILFNILNRKEDNPEIVWLLKIITFNNPAKNPIIKGQLSLFDQIPPHKSLFHTQNKTGLPIGNYTSQFFANVYLNELDQFVKHRLKCRHYIRYVDDMVLLSPYPKELEGWEKLIQQFLQKHLKLELNANRRVLAPLSNGCNFLGYIVRPTYILVRKRIVNNLKSKMYHNNSTLVNKWKGATIIRHDRYQLDQLQAVLASYLGHFQHASSYKLRRAIFYRFRFLNEYFSLKKARIHRTDIPPRFANLSAQYKWFCRRYKGGILFFQIGNFYEFYGKQARMVHEIFDLKKGAPRRRLGRRSGFPIYHLNAYLEKALSYFGRITVICQTGRIAGNIMERRVRLIIANIT